MENSIALERMNGDAGAGGVSGAIDGDDPQFTRPRPEEIGLSRFGSPDELIISEPIDPPIASICVGLERNLTRVSYPSRHEVA